uniref:Leukotriene C4 synthase n=1 Tax=Amphiprion ocellaris TaxID=80972 RepID=A0A3Q1CUF9_AMPOC
LVDEIQFIFIDNNCSVFCAAYFSLQVIYARRKYSVSPPSTAGPPEFERIFRAQANCSEYFPIFITMLWTAGLFLSPGESTPAVASSLWLRSTSALRFSGFSSASRLSEFSSRSAEFT